MAMASPLGLLVCDQGMVMAAPDTRPLATVITEWARRTPDSHVHKALTDPLSLPRALSYASG